MGTWHDDECWSDCDEVADFHRHRTRPPANDEEEPESTEPLVSVEEAFVGSVYWIADRLWGFHAPERVAHPGVCVRCELRHQRALLVKGTTVRVEQAWRYQGYEFLVVKPTTENGLNNPTAFALDPRPIDLRILRRIHLDEGPRGHVSGDVLWAMRARLADLEHALGEGTP